MRIYVDYEIKIKGSMFCYKKGHAEINSQNVLAST